MKKFKEFSKSDSKKKKVEISGETDSFSPPEYVVEPAKNDKGFFMFKDAFDKMKKRYETGYFSTSVNNS